MLSSQTPQLLAPLQDLPNLAGGVYSVQRRAGAASFVNLPLAPAG